MEVENKVMLLGMRGSPYSMRVELALKVKGIPYEYVEEDLKNKSDLLIKYNPVHKKVPVLVHNGKPIAESLVILEYIDEIWANNAPKLLPEDPYTRAQVHFWTSFLHQQLFESIRQVITTDGEAQERAIKEAYQKLQAVEEGMKTECFPASRASITMEKLGLLDIVMCSILGSYKAFEEAAGVKLMDPERNPLIFSWVTALIDQLPVLDEVKPPHSKMVAFLQSVRQSALRTH